MSLRIVAPFVRKRLRDLPVALVSTLSGLFILYGTAHWHSHSHDLYFLNYREEGLFVWLWLAACVLLHSLVVYGSAWLFGQLYPRRTLIVEPVFLMVGGVIGGITGLMTPSHLAPIPDAAGLSSALLVRATGIGSHTVW